MQDLEYLIQILKFCAMTLCLWRKLFQKLKTFILPSVVPCMIVPLATKSMLSKNNLSLSIDKLRPISIELQYHYLSIAVLLNHLPQAIW